jgi:arginine/lysine/histidine/glutamine transport system substrate-binding/permease protein
LKGKTVAVQIGTTGAEAAKGVPGIKIRTFNAAVLALQELKNGNVDAVISDSPIALYALKNGNLEGINISRELLSEEYYGIPTAKNSPNLQLINQGLTQILQNNVYTQLYQKWFNAQPPQLPDAAPGIAPDTQGTKPGSLGVVLSSMPTLLAGALITLELAAISAVLGLIGGSLLGIARLSPSKGLRWLARAYIDFFRGTPLLVQIFMIYFGLPAIIQQLGVEFSFDRFIAAVVALTLNAAAYIAEIVRAGIQSIDVGQSEASQSLGLSSKQTLRYIIFPQALRRMIPPLGNEFISLLKDTSLVAIIGFEELFRQGQLIVAENYRPFELYAAVALIYLGLTLLSSQAFSYLEHRMNPAKQSASKKRSQSKQASTNVASKPLS